MPAHHSLMPDRNCFYLYLITLIWMPLPAGSNWPWATALLQLLIFTTAIYWLVLNKKNDVTINAPFLKAIPIIILLAIWLFWIFVQFLPLPVFLVELISPHTAELMLQFSPIGDQQSDFISISLDPFQTFQQFVWSVALVTFFLLSLLLINSRKRIRWTLWVIVYSALFQAAFGSLMTLSGVEQHLFGPKQHFIGVATGTFIARTHLAGYLVMCLAIGIGLLLSQLKNHSDHNSQQIRDRIGVMLSEKMQIRAILIILVIGLVLTHSRIGNSAFFISLLITGFLWAFVGGRRINRSTALLFVSLIVIDLFIVGTWFGFDKVVTRLQATSVATESRDEVVKSLLVAIPQFGLSGSGLGTFKTVYPLYKDSDIKISYLYAHNDYLQFVLEGGVAVILLLIVVVLALGSAYSTIRLRNNPLYRGLGFTSLMGIIAILIQSMVDFNLQIPANAMMFMLLLAFALIGRYAANTNTGKLP